jgi:ABC-type transporter Mla subunit MlaD
MIAAPRLAALAVAAVGLAAGCGGESTDRYLVEFDRPSAPKEGARVVLESEEVGEVAGVREERRRFGAPLVLATLEVEAGTQIRDGTGALRREDGAVALVPPKARTGPLPAGTRIPVARTSRCPHDPERLTPEAARACED